MSDLHARPVSPEDSQQWADSFSAALQKDPGLLALLRQVQALPHYGNPSDAVSTHRLILQLNERAKADGVFIPPQSAIGPTGGLVDPEATPSQWKAGALGIGLAGADFLGAGMLTGGFAGGIGAAGSGGTGATGATGTGAAATTGTGGTAAGAGGAGAAGSGAATAGGGTAATGGGFSIPGLIKAGTAIGQGATALESGRAQGRVQEAGINSGYDQNRLRASQLMEQALENRAGIDLQQREYALKAPQLRANNSARGDVLANMQDMQVQGPITNTHGQIPTITGGMRPSLLSDNTRQLGQNMSRDALLQNMNGADTFQPMPAPNIPTITPPPQAGAGDSLLNGIGLGGGLMGMGSDFMNLFKKPNIPNIPGMNNGVPIDNTYGDF